MSVKALKHSSVPASLVMRSFQEGLCNETSSRSRRKPKENAQYHLVNARLYSYIYEFLCVIACNRLLKNYKFIFLINKVDKRLLKHQYDIRQFVIHYCDIRVTVTIVFTFRNAPINRNKNKKLLISFKSGGAL